MIKRLSYLMILLSLLLSCGKDSGGSSVPPPSGGQEQSGGQGEGEEHPWDANRGKVVRPDAGNGWTVTPIEEGIVYYYFEGYEPVSTGNQRIYVTDIDLNNTSYSLVLGYYASKTTASKVMQNKNAIAVINAGYEKGALYLRVNGSTISTISDDPYINGTTVPQWKSEAALYMDNVRDVRIEFTGKGVTSPSVWRNLYRQKAATESNILTSAPMLIDDYEPVGLDFCSLHPKKSSSSEDPYNHQASTSNPRTAIAKTHDNHVLFVVVDGRRTISRGISAAELTNFLVTNFNPQYALNLDGGGSSTMCVKGQGDPTTHVVNYPTDSDEVNPRPGAGDHTGERSRDTYLYVVKN